MAAALATTMMNPSHDEHDLPDRARFAFSGIAAGALARATDRSIAPGCSSSTKSSALRGPAPVNLVKQYAALEGTHHAVHANMYDADAIEAINFEQLATATDRLLLRGRQVSRRRPSTPSLPRPSTPSMAMRPLASMADARTRSTLRHLERTAIIRRAAGSRVEVFAVTVVIPTLAGIAVGLAALL